MERSGAGDYNVQQHKVDIDQMAIVIRVPRGFLATKLQITEWKLLYTLQALLLGFNVTLDICDLNIGF
ncbi:hypothetical protein [Noviherbaspirillum autotrophicum]|uniref:hypothetical protein n=1 Tax=Noviherbaspirillum autotrophicum TaxID=709839 RepID=UPI0012FD6496|nr:hypothetical protein [Noviherbaspirillum autotrophicum]